VQEQRRQSGEVDRESAEGTRTTAEELREVHEQLRSSAEDARRAAEELRTASEIALKAAYDQVAIMQEMRDTLLQYEAQFYSRADATVRSPVSDEP
jgi:hypothetical protein